MSIPVVIDTDPGIDDSMAILLALASPEIDVVGITTVMGNGGVEHTARNAATICAVAGRPDIPIGIGASQPLVRPYHGQGARIHGPDGLGGTGLGLSTPVPTEPALALLYRWADAYAGDLVLITLGPLTNIALAVQARSSFASKIRRVVCMGGAARLRGNVTPVAEANVHNDPEAAAIVFEAAWPLAMVGLDVTEKTILDAAFLEHITGRESRTAAFLRAIVPCYVAAHRSRGLDGAIFTHDPSAVAYVIDPDAFSITPVPVKIETRGEWTLGATVPDWQGQWTSTHAVAVATDVDSHRVRELLDRRLAILP
jgi:purine nucleosidase